MYRCIELLSRCALGATKGAFMGAVIWGVPLFTLDTVKAFYDAARGEPQAEIRINAGKVGDQDVIITHSYELYYTKTVVPYVCAGLAGLCAIFELSKNKKTLDDNVKSSVKGNV